MDLTISGTRTCLERVPLAGLALVAATVPALTTSVFLMANRAHRFSDGALGMIVGVGLGVSLVCLTAALMKMRLAR